MNELVKAACTEQPDYYTKRAKRIYRRHEVICSDIQDVLSSRIVVLVELVVVIFIKIRTFVVVLASLYSI
jgi:hypothetical protein